MRDRNVRKRLPDHGNAVTADLLHGGRFEHATGGRVESLGAVECGFVGQEDVLREELSLEAFKVAA